MPINESVSARDSKILQGGGEVANRQDQSIYVPYRDVDPVQFVNEAYSGTGGFSGKTGPKSKSYIIPNASENFYHSRIQMSSYVNYFKKFIDAQWRQIFKSNIKNYVETENGSDMPEHLYLDFCEDVTGSGINKSDFLKTCVASALVSDVVYICMDKIEGDVEPYLYMMPSVSVVSYSTGRKGELTSITFYDGCKDVNGKTIHYMRYIGLDKWEMLQSEDGKNYTAVAGSAVDNTLGFLPVYAMWTVRNSNADYRPIPSNYDIAAFSAWHYDKSSKLDYVIDKQAHSILALQGNIDSVPNGVDNALVIGESQSSIFPPQYLSPNAQFPQVHADRIDQVVNAMFDIMGDAGVSVSPSTMTGESGIAKSYTFSAINDRLKQIVTVLKGADKWIQMAYKVFTGDTSGWISYTEYPADFTPTASLTIEQATSLIDFYGVEGLPKNQIDLHKRLRNLVDPMATKEDEQDLLDEINTRYNTLE
jgi:hypothetical protein